MSKKYSVASVCAVILFLAITFKATASDEITVSAAISLKNAFEDMGKSYENVNNGEKIILNFNSSGALARQIEAGAPVDVFASAALREMDRLVKKGFVAAATRTDFATNSVVLVSPNIGQGKTKPLPVVSFQSLVSENVAKISIGNPETVPAGRYAKEALRFLKLWDGIREKIIFAENVRQVLDYVARGEVDAGMVYSTDAAIRPRDVRVVMKAPKGGHRPIVYPIGVVKGTKNAGLAKRFIEFVQTGKGKTILRKYGFGVMQ